MALIEELSARKRHFLNELPSSASKLNPERFMCRLEQLETQWDFDLCQTTDREVIDSVVTNIIASKRLLYINRAIDILYRYCQWCLEYKYTDHNPLEGVEGVDIDLTAVIQRDMFPNADALSNFLRNYRPSVSPDNLATMYHGYYWTLFMGLTPEQACDLKKTDVNDAGTLIQCNHENIEIPSKAKFALLTAKEMKEVVYGGQNAVATLYASDNLFVNIVKNMTPKDFWFTDRRYKDRYKTRGLDWEDVYFSGLFCKAAGEEAAGKKYDFSYLFQNDLNKEGQYMSKILYNYENKIKDIENLYRWWRRAFNI